MIRIKLAIIGFSGSGKSTLSNNLGNKYNIPVLHLDKVQFLPNWKERNLDEGLKIVGEFMSRDSWIIDGNYSKFYFDRRMLEADKIIFLNFTRVNCFYRGFRRYLVNKGKTREDMAEGCIEKFDLEFAWWILWQGRSPTHTNIYFETIAKYKDKSLIVKNQNQLNQLNLNWDSQNHYNC